MYDPVLFSSGWLTPHTWTHRHTRSDYIWDLPCSIISVISDTSFMGGVSYFSFLVILHCISETMNLTLLDAGFYWVSLKCVVLFYCAASFLGITGISPSNAFKVFWSGLQADSAPLVFSYPWHCLWAPQIFSFLFRSFCSAQLLWVVEAVHYSSVAFILVE